MLNVILSKCKAFMFNKKWRKKNPHNFTYVTPFVDLNKIKVGNYTYGVINLNDFSSDDICLTIGSYCSISKGVEFLLSGEHHINTISTYPFKVMKFGQKQEAFSKNGKGIVVGDDVWIGTNATICSGVTIGQGAVIAAGAVVTHDVEPYSVVGGVPATLIKYRFGESLRGKLKKIDLNKLYSTFSSEDIDNIYSTLDDKILDLFLERIK